MGMIIFDLRGCGGYYRPKTSYLGAHFGSVTQRLVHPSVPVLLTKDSPRNEISHDFQPPFSLHISNLEPSPQGLISSVIYCFCLPLPSEFTVHQEWTILYFTLPCIIDRPPYQSINQSEKKLPIKNTLFSRST